MGSECGGGHGERPFRLFGVELSAKVGVDEDSQQQHTKKKNKKKKKKNDGDSGKNIPETALHPKRKVIQWSSEEHKRFLVGLKEEGRGNWKEIASKYVKTRSKSQVASHAQKYFLHVRESRQSKHRRSSVFDMSIDQPVDASCQDSTCCSSSSPCLQKENASTSGMFQPMPINIKAINVESNYSSSSRPPPYMVGEIPQNMVGGLQGLASTQRFSPAVVCVPMFILSSRPHLP